MSNKRLSKTLPALRTRAGYVRFWTICWGIPMGAYMAWSWYARDRALSVIWLLLGPVGGYTCGVLMWKFFQRDRVIRLDRAEKDRSAGI